MLDIIEDGNVLPDHPYFMVKDVINKVIGKHINEFDDMEISFLNAIKSYHGNEKYIPLGSLSKSFKEWYEKC